MGNQLWNEDDELFQHKHPGCMSGILHALVDYHQWQSNVKRILPHKKQDLLRHDKRNRNPRIALIENDSFEVKSLLDAEANQPHVDKKTKASSIKKRSLRARIRALVSEPGHDQKGRVPRLKRTLSIHHLDDWGNPIIFLHKNADTGASKMMDYNQLKEINTGQEEKPKNLIEAELVQEKNLRHASDHEDNEYGDILEMFKVNKDLFQNVLKNTEDNQCLNTKARLTKSGSFPTMYSPTGKTFRPAKLENKKTEIYSFPKREKLISDARAPKLVLSKSGPLVFDGSANELNKGSFSHIRRISSLHDSTDRYSHLFETSSSMLPKLHISKSLRLTNENEIPSRSHASMFFKRILSFPHLNSQESQDEKEPGSLPVIINRYVGINYEEGPDYVNSVVERDEKISPRAEYSAYSTEGICDMDYHEIAAVSEKEQEEEISIEVQPTEDFFPESCFQEVKINAEFHNSEGPDKSEVSSLETSSTEILQHACYVNQPEKFETEKQCVKNHKRIKSCVKDDGDFIYVRDILEFSGFTSNGLNSSWYSSDHPLDPSLFEELEYCYPCEQECFEEGITALSRHLLLFDLVDEVLFDLFSKSYTYYPKALSSFCHVHPVPIGYHFVNEVWENIRRSLSNKPERMKYQDLNWVVSQDLGKNDGWMNLQFDSESLALELEELILEELLGEIFVVESLKSY